MTYPSGLRVKKIGGAAETASTAVTPNRISNW